MKSYIKTLAAGTPLSEEETFELFEACMGKGEISDAQIGAYLFSTGSRTLTADELAGGARSLRKNSVALNVEKSLGGGRLVDTCGTGGSGKDTFNTSTVSAFVVAAAGGYVAKHGNRGATSKCGSADILEALGVKITLSAEQSLSCLEQTRFCFMFAPQHHPATKRAQIIRKELGIRTIFNFLGPLSNPAGAQYQLLGVSSPAMVETMAEALKRLGAKRAMVVCGEDGLDELTLTGNSHIAEVEEGSVRSYQLSPSEYGLSLVEFDKIKGGEPSFSVNNVRSVLSGEKGAYRDLVVLNSGAALYVSGISNSIAEGIELSSEMLDTGGAQQVLEQVIKTSNEL